MTDNAFWTTPVHQPHQGAEDHPHGPGCGHPSAVHAAQHVDYLVDGHAHHAHEGHWDECDPAALADLWRSRAASQVVSSDSLYPSRVTSACARV